MKSETRIFPRKILRCHGRVLVAGTAPLPARTLDISLGGVCLFVPQQLRVGQACSVALDTAVNGKPHPIVANAKIIYSILSGTDGFRTGLQFVQLDTENNKTLAELMG